MHSSQVPPERRRHARTQLQMTLHGIRLDPDCNDVLTALHMTDISRSGMGAMTDKAFYRGQRLVLCLPLSSAGGRRNIYATVVRCRHEREGYRLGLEFDNASLSAWYGTGDRALVAA